MAAVFTVYWLLGNRVYQNVLLLVASVLFYGWVHPWFLIPLYFSSVLDFFVAKGIERRPDKKRLLLLVSMCGNLGMLGVFKYYDFFVENFQIAFTSLGVPFNLSTLNLLLPVGISFYTFQTMSYTIDVFRGELKARNNFLDYVVYVGFFPQLVAGPIERAGNLLPQVERPRVWNTDLILSGFGLTLWGAFKKVCVADLVAPYVDKVHLLEEPNSALVWAAVAGFGVQILADFSAYTDMARGTARMLGFNLVPNFNRPYVATTTPDFWRRWHMSLSSWIADYVYVPLVRGGNPGWWRMTWAMMFTFFLIGIWHGAAWTFVLLGLWHGMWMVVYTLGVPLIPRKIRKMPFGRPLAILFHTVFVICPGGLMFREVNIARVIQHLSQNPLDGSREQFVAASIVVAITLVAAIPMVVAVYVEDNWLDKIKKSPWGLPLITSFWGLEAACILVFYRNTVQDFIYFAF